MPWRAKCLSASRSAVVALGVVLMAVGCAKGTATDDSPLEDELDANTTTADAATRRDSATPVELDASLPDGARGPDGSKMDGAAGDATVDATVDGGGACAKAAPNNVCGLNPQCGCAANETCDVTSPSNGAATCVTSGTTAAGRTCTTTSQCDTGLTCWNGACHPYCTRGQTTCGGATICFAPQNAGGTTTPNLDVCSVACDVRSAATVCGTNACVWFTSQKASDCRPAGTRAEYATCTSTGDCRQGFVCADDPTFGPTCVRWCRLGSNADCALGDTCTDEFGASAPSSGGTRLGVCYF